MGFHCALWLPPTSQVGRLIGIERGMGFDENVGRIMWDWRRICVNRCLIVSVDLEGQQACLCAACLPKTKKMNLSAVIPKPHN